MTITPTPEIEISPKDELIFDVMQIIDFAKTSEESFKTYEIAEQIVDAAKESRFFGGEGKDRREFWTNLTNIDGDD